jgi:hypothetical protein
MILCSAFQQYEYEHDCLVADCVEWLSNLRSCRADVSMTSCPVPETVICQKVAERRFGNSTLISEETWIPSTDDFVSNILRVVDAQTWKNCVIVYDVRACEFPLYRYVLCENIILDGRIID